MPVWKASQNTVKYVKNVGRYGGQALVAVSAVPKSIDVPWFSNNALKLKPLHSKNFSEGDLRRASFGVTTAGRKRATAHFPSLYYWLLHCCGISLAETKQLSLQGRLYVNDFKVVQEGDLEYQHTWADLNKLRVEIESESENRVPATDRSKHRKYYYVHMPRGATCEADVTDPRSFVHFAAFPEESSPLLITGAGYDRRMSGLAIATNDALALSYYHHIHHGCPSYYQVAFIKGTPPEMKERVIEALHSSFRGAAQLPDIAIRGLIAPAVAAPLVEELAGVVAEATRCSDSDKRSVTPQETPHSSLFQFPLNGFRQAPVDEADRLILQCSLWPHRLRSDITKSTDGVKCLGIGPFRLPNSLASRAACAFSENDLQLFFAYEKKLKINRLVATLRQLSDASPALPAFSAEREDEGE